MPYFEIIWNEEPGGNVEHISEHDLEPEDVISWLSTTRSTT
jgi:hypothetical protein